MIPTIAPGPFLRYLRVRWWDSRLGEQTTPMGLFFFFFLSYRSKLPGQITSGQDAPACGCSHGQDGLHQALAGTWCLHSRQRRQGGNTHHHCPAPEAQKFRTQDVPPLLDDQVWEQGPHRLGHEGGSGESQLWGRVKELNDLLSVFAPHPALRQPCSSHSGPHGTH